MFSDVTLYVQEFKKMATYKLTYFNIMGLGETIRYMLSYLGKDFEDFRINEYPSWVNEHKPSELTLK